MKRLACLLAAMLLFSSCRGSRFGSVTGPDEEDCKGSECDDIRPMYEPPPEPAEDTPDGK